MNKDIPRMSPMLATLEPIIFPSTRPPAPDLIAEIEVNNSGAEVATDTIVRPTITGGTPSSRANTEQLSESKSPPLVKKNSPIIVDPTSKTIKPGNEISLKEEPQMSINSYTKEVKFAILRSY
jgi:hypothetical protein